LIQLRSQSKNIKLKPEKDGITRFDDGFLEMAGIDRKSGAAIFDACRRLLPVHVLSVDSRLINIAKRMMKNDLVIASDVKAVRIDYPDEAKYLFDWHQDYPYIMDSEDAVVFWIPLQDVDDRNGALKVAVGSSKLGLMKLRISDFRNKQNNKQQFMEIVEKDKVNDFPQISVPASIGDVLVFSTMTLHASQPNVSTRARWTAQIRFGNFSNPKSVERDWPGSLRDGSWFDEKHPEYVVNLEELEED
jgi:hypothetical protein